MSWPVLRQPACAKRASWSSCYFPFLLKRFPRRNPLNVSLVFWRKQWSYHRKGRKTESPDSHWLSMSSLFKDTWFHFPHSSTEFLWKSVHQPSYHIQMCQIPLPGSDWLPWILIYVPCCCVDVFVRNICMFGSCCKWALAESKHIHTFVFCRFYTGRWKGYSSFTDWQTLEL